MNRRRFLAASSAALAASVVGLRAQSTSSRKRLRVAMVGTGVRVMVVRPGFVRTKMTEGMEAAPFSTTPDKVAHLIVDGLTKGTETVWAPPVLKYPFFAFRLLPRALWRKVSERG